MVQTIAPTPLQSCRMPTHPATIRYPELSLHGTCRQTHTRANPHTHTNTQTHTHTHARTHTHAHSRKHAHMHAYECSYTSAYMHVDTRTCIGIMYFRNIPGSCRELAPGMPSFIRVQVGINHTCVYAALPYTASTLDIVFMLWHLSVLRCGTSCKKPDMRPCPGTLTTCKLSLA